MERKQKYERHVRKEYAKRGVTPSDEQIASATKKLSIRQDKFRRKNKARKVKKAEKAHKQAVKATLASNRATEKRHKQAQSDRAKAERAAESKSRREAWEKRIKAGETAYATNVARQIFNSVVTRPLSRLSSMGDLSLTRKK